jgi:glycosyltransferase involved in cell wall biosynthesis
MSEGRSFGPRLARNLRRIGRDVRRFLGGSVRFLAWLFARFDRNERLRPERFVLKQFIERNTTYLKKDSSGNDLVIYCGKTPHEWDPDPAKIVGGSEEAVINLTRELVKLGWNVSVFNSCGHKPVADHGVMYRPFWDFNPRDRQDAVIVWRWPARLDWTINAKGVFIDLHDALPEQVFTHKNRLAKVDCIFVKSEYQKSLLPGVPGSKIAVIPNGIDLDLLNGDTQKDPHLLINTSSPDRSLSILPTLFRRVKEQVPQARLQWAYGWDFFELFHRGHPDGIRWMQRTREDMAEAGIESLGHLTHAEVAKLYQRASILAYPTEFVEIDCISVRKAQACGCVPVTTDVGALADSVQFGIKVPVRKAAASAARRFFYGLDDPGAQRLWVAATVELLTNGEKRAKLAVDGTRWARQFAWPQIAARWNEVLRRHCNAGRCSGLTQQQQQRFGE